MSQAMAARPRRNSQASDPRGEAGPGRDLDVIQAAQLSPEQVLTALSSGPAGLSAAEAARRLATGGPNAVRTHHAKALGVLVRQLRNAVMILLAVTAAISFALGERSDAVIIGVILTASIGLGFVNEFRAERAVEALHNQVHHVAATVRDGHLVETDVIDLVPGDVIHLALGNVVPADVRLLTATTLECDESVLTGESLPVDKTLEALTSSAGLGDLTCCALMGTIVRAGSGIGVVVATGARAQFGKIALGLGDRQPETDFQIGLRSFSLLLLRVAMALTTIILVVNLVLRRPLIDSILFSLAIAVGITPQLLPAVVSMSLATGSRLLAARKVLVKRMVCIEDLGDMDVLVTDKTGTLTEGQISFESALAPDGSASDEVLLLGLLATEIDLAAVEWQPDGSAVAPVGANSLDAALWAARQSAVQPVQQFTRVGLLPFDHEGRRTSTLVRGPGGAMLLVSKGAPESVLATCDQVPAEVAATLERLYAAGGRVVAVASKPATGSKAIAPADVAGLTLAGFLVFLDRPKAAAAASLTRLAELGIEVKIATGDHPLVAEKVCAQLGLASKGTLTGDEVALLDDAQLEECSRATTIFARITPEQKARIVTSLRQRGRAIGFLGDGVNDALALHAADVGISVDSATDVAKDAADVVLLEKDLGVLADGVSGGRRIFANTIKYVLMGTSSNFGNMFSAAAASAVLSFLPMLPGQILLNNLLYDSSQLALPTDNVDPEQLQAPSHWDIRFIQRFMMFFGPISSLFDFLTFAVLIGVFGAHADLFRSGWFVESLATQTLVIFAIRTRRSPFYRSRPSRGLVISAAVVVVIGTVLPLSPLAGVLGFTTLPVGLLAVIALEIVAYLVLIELAKKFFFGQPSGRLPGIRQRGRGHEVARRAARFSAGQSLG